jgi:AraC family transcriptional regulator, arabinose operon regulatory protein
VANANPVIHSLQTEVISGARTVCGKLWANNGRDVHNDPFSRLYWIESGRGEILHAKGRIDLAPGRLFVIPAHTPARYKATDQMVLFWIHFRARLFGCMELFSVMNWEYSAPIPAESGIPALWKDMIAICRSQKLQDSLQADGLLRQMLSFFAAADRAPAPHQLSELQRFLPTITFIEQNLRRRIRLEELAATVSLQPAYFCHLFSETVGQSPIEFVNRKRIERAQVLLLGEKRPLKETAAEVGFEDVYYFSRIFKAVAGISPAHYSAQQRHRE